VLAGWWYRVGATLIDGLVLLIPNAIIGVSASNFFARWGIGAVLQAVYLTVLLGSSGKTVGNRAVSTITVDGQTGGPITYGRAFVRAAVQILLQVTVIGGLLDVLWPLWDQQNQTLHDKAVGTLVLRTR
jgi:uncharacterized RDD family membrane protein YckC